MEYYGTLGPACGSVQTLKEMLAAGMTGVRLNLSHGDLEENGHWIRMVQEAGRELHSQVQILMDLRGPELRLGRFKEEIQAEEGSWLVLGDGGLPVPEEALAYVCPGDRILIDDGKVELEAEAGAAPSASGCRIMARVVRGGLIKSGKSLAIEGKAVPMPTLTESDRKNIREAVSYGITGVMLPFVRNKEDLLVLRRLLRRPGPRDPGLCQDREHAGSGSHKGAASVLRSCGDRQRGPGKRHAFMEAARGPEEAGKRMPGSWKAVHGGDPDAGFHA